MRNLVPLLSTYGLVKLAGEIQLGQTISEAPWASEEHSNTKLTRWFRESKMQELLADEMGFTSKTAPSFHKNEDPDLNGSNAYYQPFTHEIHYDTGEWTPGVLAHELGHSTMDISPGAKAFNAASKIIGLSALPLALGASSLHTDKLAPTLMEALTHSGGLSGKIKALMEGAKGRGSRWALGAGVLGGLGTILEEARASSHGKKGIDRLVQEGVLSEEQGDQAKSTMSGALGTYIKNTPLSIIGDAVVHSVLGAGARKVLPDALRHTIATGIGGLSAAAVIGAYYGHGRKRGLMDYLASPGTENLELDLDK